MRGRFLLTALVLAIVLLGISAYGQSLVKAIGAESHRQIQTYYGSHRLLQETKTALGQVERALHEAMIHPDAIGSVRAAVAGLRAAVGRLTSDPTLAGQPIFSGLPAAVDEMSTRLDRDLGRWSRGEAAAPVGLVDGLRDVLHLCERRVYDAMVDKTYLALGTSDTLSIIIWGLTGVIFLIVLAAYGVFELSIRRPVLRVAEALRAEGRGAVGETDVPMPRTIETWLLVDAFNGMRLQVHSRQLRLQSVLESTSDGIITVDDKGSIESINGAAERVLGLTRDEAVGRPLGDLIPLDRLAEDGGEEGALSRRLLALRGREIDLPARRADGAAFHLSLKLSDFMLGERRYFNALIADVTDRKAMIDRLTFLAQRDPLTGLINRRSFFDDLEKAVARAGRFPAAGVAVISIDLDRFKYVNDSLGHQAGDCLLKEVAEVLFGRLRETDLLARLGGDEFAVLLHGVNREGALHVAEALRLCLADYAFSYDGKSVEIGCSLGVATWAADVDDPEDLLARADMAMRLAKRAGRNRVHLFEEGDLEVRARVVADAGYSKLIDRGLRNNLFRPVFQPIIDVTSGAVVGHETLARLHDPAAIGLTMDVLIPVAERFGLAVEIDRQIILAVTEALAEDAGWLEGGFLSFNLSAQSVGDGRIFSAVRRLIATRRLPPQALIFEITETAAIASLAAARTFLKALTDLGCKTALDDFGSGYSSFTYLRELPVDFLKIDGRYVRDIHHDPVKAAMVQAINTVAHAMGMRTIAECVEEASGLEVLRQSGVDCAQGFLFGRPAPLGPWIVPNPIPKGIGRPRLALVAPEGR
ncbi:diguanylate cyclase/phosphodiesterase with PAS/PAC sensor(s) [Rhodospirillum rubrum F11]|nr:diguanylate cyclase/phosphodiesterase with PAS/PAC sensor(s) [Rhodospirillum rubrum F11]